jgi:hypothetical protein
MIQHFQTDTGRMTMIWARGASGIIILSSFLLILLFLSGCFGVVGTYIERGGSTQQIETLEGRYLLEGTAEDDGYLLFTPDGRMEFIEGGDAVYSGRYLIVNDRAYIAQGSQAPTGDSTEEYFILKSGGDDLVDSDGYVWRREDVLSHQTLSETETPVATPPPTGRVTTQDQQRRPDPILEYPAEIEGAIFSLTAEPNIPAEKLSVGVTINSRRSGDGVEREKTDLPLQRVRITFFAYNIPDTEEEFMPRTFAEVYYSEIPYVTKHHTINPDVIESKGVDLPVDAARGTLNVREPYNYGAIIEIV